MQSELIQIQKQYERIPTMECIPGCVSCCGPVPITEAEATLIDLKPFTGTSCQYLGPSGCTVYDRRPLLCRLYGTVDDPGLTCPYGKGPVKKLTKQQGRTIMHHYLKHKRAQDPLTDQSWLRL